MPLNGNSLPMMRTVVAIHKCLIEKNRQAYEELAQ